MNCLKLANPSLKATSSQEEIHSLINIYWSDLINQQVIEKSLHCMMELPFIPEPLETFMELMKERETAEHPCNPFSIIEPYGEVLETLNPDYYANCRAVYYQERDYMEVATNK